MTSTSTTSTPPSSCGAPRSTVIVPLMGIVSEPSRLLPSTEPDTLRMLVPAGGRAPAGVDGQTTDAESTNRARVRTPESPEHKVSTVLLTVAMPCDEICGPRRAGCWRCHRFLSSIYETWCDCQCCIRALLGNCAPKPHGGTDGVARRLLQRPTSSQASKPSGAEDFLDCLPRTCPMHSGGRNLAVGRWPSDSNADSNLAGYRQPPVGDGCALGYSLFRQRPFVDRDGLGVTDLISVVLRDS